MSTTGARADAGWLALREPADAAARSRDLVDLLLPHLPAGRVVVHDLGCGTGSMGRWLAPLLPGKQHWVLHERDEALLPHAVADGPRRAGDGDVVTCAARPGDVTDLGEGGLAGASVIVASALLDVLTRSEVERLVATIAGAGAPALITLSVTGEVALTPPARLDGAIREAFNAHQRRRGPAGALLGPDAAGLAARLLEDAGLEVHRRPSPWHLGPGRTPLLRAWFDGWLAAAWEQRPALRLEGADDVAARRAQLGDRRLRATVDHEDLLALPRPPGAAGHPRRGQPV